MKTSPQAVVVEATGQQALEREWSAGVLVRTNAPHLGHTANRDGFQELVGTKMSLLVEVEGHDDCSR